MPPDKHCYFNNYFVFKEVGCGFVVNRKRYMTTQIYVLIVVFIIFRYLHMKSCSIIVHRLFP